MADIKNKNTTGIVSEKVVYFVLYVVLWSAQALLIKSSLGEDGKYPYNVVAVTMAVEFVKATVAAIQLNLDGENILDMLRMTMTKTGMLYAIPAGIYVVYNVLAFVNLQYLDPATYRVLINVRVLFSGLLLQYFFSTKLTPKQWIALLLLGIGCCVEQLGSFSATTGIIALVFMSIQALMSSMGGVYFQWLLQRHGDQTKGTKFWQKNFWMYVWSVLFNLTYISIGHTSMIQNLTWEGIKIDTLLFCIIGVGAAGGLSTAFLLRHLNVIAKEYANFAEMVVVAIAQYVLFMKPIRATLLLAIVMVSYSVYLYKTSSDEQDATSPAKTLSPTNTTRTDGDKDGGIVASTSTPQKDIAV